MAAKYQTREGDTIDRICWAYYGRTSGAVEAVLEANRATGLAARGPILPAGLVIDLPDLEAASAETTISLWD
ncbi:Tail protein X [uncultured Alphaproteobacteria bacterium]|uniref:Tail protein X n=1 Tax=uncultured Alphaproteobacteria bacterium TaxID=91750 RepID=A0A212KMZ3_9PROT|nr:Tail protein X [uncultured Alphaproteobacteria bacterium]